MYLSFLRIENFRCIGKGANCFEMSFKSGLTALVGENDSGKSAVIDALRLALGTTDLEWFRLEDSDFNESTIPNEIRIKCKFEGLNLLDKRAFIEHLTYGENVGDEPAFFLNWAAKSTGEIRRGRTFRRVEVHSGSAGDGPTIPVEVRDLLRATYLRPLRDADQVLSSGRNSRLAQILFHSDRIRDGQDACDTQVPLDTQDLSIHAISKLIDNLLEKQNGIVGTRIEINKHLSDLSLSGDGMSSAIKASGSSASIDTRIRQMLQKLDLILSGPGKLGLGSNNLMFMACELLLLSQEDEGIKLLLIEEPEAHLHAQRQLRVIKSMQEKAMINNIQIIITTHSPNLASAIKLDSLVMINKGRAFSMAEGNTCLQSSDYRFLQRFLDSTKANLFFAHGVMIVEGDAENILIPTLATILNRDFTENGVSIVNVGGVGLRRYSRIFQRSDSIEGELFSIPVACVTDMDVMPDCAPEIIGLLDSGASWSELSDKRRWRAKRDIGDKEALSKFREEKRKKVSGQSVNTFVSDEWTLEYDLAFCGLSKEVYVSAFLARKDESLTSKTLRKEKVKALEGYEVIEQEALNSDCSKGRLYKEILASKVYALFTTGTKASKAISAQYLAECLIRKINAKVLTSDGLRRILPKYLLEAIEYVTPFASVQSSEESNEIMHHE